jgi:hypothetical protein
LRDSLDAVFVRRCHNCLTCHDDHSLEKPSPFPDKRPSAVRAGTYLLVLRITPGEYLCCHACEHILLEDLESGPITAVPRIILSLDVCEPIRYSDRVAWYHEVEFGLEVANPVTQEVIEYTLLIAEKDGQGASVVPFQS